MKTNVENYKNYVISTEEGTEKGIFFRSPIQKVFFDGYNFEAKMSAWDYLGAIENPFRRFFEILMGNREIIKHGNEWSDDISFGGFYVNILCFPVYFHREYRKLNAVLSQAFSASPVNENIVTIVSHGYESQYNECAGACAIEKTTIYLRNKKKIKKKKKEYYYYTYSHVVKKIIDTGEIDQH